MYIFLFVKSNIQSNIWIIEQKIYSTVSFRFIPGNGNLELFDSESGPDLTLSPQTFTSTAEAFINDNSDSLGVPGDNDTGECCCWIFSIAKRSGGDVVWLLLYLFHLRVKIYITLSLLLFFFFFNRNRWYVCADTWLVLTNYYDIHKILRSLVNVFL